MSRRTLPIYGYASASGSYYPGSLRHYNTGFSHAQYATRHTSMSSTVDSPASSGTTGTATTTTAITTSTSMTTTNSITTTTVQKDAAIDIFDGLDAARFDQVRRAVMTDPGRVLNATRDGKTPVAYALDKCQKWSALAAHCRRTGTSVPGVGDGYSDLTFSERLSTMNVIIPWLISFSETSLDNSNNHSLLHVALSCGLDNVTSSLLQRYPHFVNIHLSTTGKSPLHTICCTNPLRMTSVRLIHDLFRADSCTLTARCQDNEGYTPLHDLIRSAAQLPAHGLVHRRTRFHANSRGATTTSPDTLLCLAKALILHGARLSHRNYAGVDCVEFAQQKGLDKSLLINAASIVRNQLSHISHKYSPIYPSLMGMWTVLPDEIIAKILSFLTPLQALHGIGSTCRSLRHLATASFVWTHIDAPYSLDLRKFGQTRGTPSDDVHVRKVTWPPR